MALSNEIEAERIAIAGYMAEHYVGGGDGQVESLKMLDEYTAAHVAAALTEAADDPSLRLTGHSGISIRRLRDRAAAIPPPDSAAQRAP